VEKANKEMKDKKATGDDDVPGDILKLLEVSCKIITQLINHIYETQEWSKDFTEVKMNGLEEKPKATKCSDHWIISLIVHTAKIVVRILGRRIGSKIGGVLGQDKFGFRRGKGTRDAIGMLRIIVE
jgi:hypothetical protein